jgi:PAS domain-containing protein
MPQSLRILLVADDPETIRRIGHGLQSQDAGLILIEGADSLATARRRLAAGSYDLALVDLALGAAGGLHLLSDLRGIAPGLPIVALAAASGGPDVAACMALGAQDRLAPDALDCVGLLDRLVTVTARARAELSARQRSERLAASLAATGDLAWYFQAGQAEAWLAAPDPAGWQLPAPECRESLDAARERIHPDDREIALRQLEEFARGAQPWQLEARFRVGGGAYRWCTLRGQSSLDSRGQLEYAAGILSDAQRQQKKLRELEHGRRLLRAVFDSSAVAQAVVDSSAVITACNQAWASLEAPSCHAGREFAPGLSFIQNPDRPEPFGDLDNAALARGLRQVLGGVVDHFRCDYGDGRDRWQIDIRPLLNPGIAGAVICHEEITRVRSEETILRAELEELQMDVRAFSGPAFRLGPDFRVLAANDAAAALGRAPVTGRDVLRVVPRRDAAALGDALAAISSGAPSAVHDSRPVDGRVMRWHVAARLGPAGERAGFFVTGVDISDLAIRPAAEAGTTSHAAIRELEAALAEAEARHDAVTGELRAARAEYEAERERMHSGWELARREAAEARSEAERERSALQAARRRESEDSQDARRLAEALDEERRRHDRTLAALSAAEQLPSRLRAELGQARHGLRIHLDQLFEQVFEPLLNEHGSNAPVDAAMPELAGVTNRDEPGAS